MVRQFVLHWGQMGHAWGINRTMAQVHALLFVTAEPLDAEAISQALEVSRSNVSTSLRELIEWGVVARVHTIGDRRDRFVALKDVLETFRRIVAERKRREVDPTIGLLERCLAQEVDPEDRFAREQLARLLEFMRLVSDWHAQIERLPTGAILRLLRGGSALMKLVSPGGPPPAGEGVEPSEPDRSGPDQPGREDRNHRNSADQSSS
jgi:DNA-binding transcriptional regulator GbsR (MarR family)